MKKNISLSIILGFVVIAGVITLEVLFPDLKFRGLLSVLLGIVCLYIVVRNTSGESLSYKSTSFILLSYVVFTCLYQVILSIITEYNIFHYSYWIILCITILLTWLRIRFGEKKAK
jgi:hypothetical protein